MRRIALLNSGVPELMWGDLLKQKFDVEPKETENKHHEIFKIVLTQIVNHTSMNEIEGLGNISDEVKKNTPRKIFREKTDKKGMNKLEESDFWNPLPHKIAGDRLYNLACHSLMRFLKIPDNMKRLKQCRYCPQFFIAGNIRKTTCDSDECERERKQEMRKQRAKKRRRIL